MAGDQFELAKGAGHEVDSTGEASIDDGPITRPRGWEYKSVTVGRLQLPWYASPPVQLVLVAFVCFLCPGMFNALGGMGGGGQIDTSAADKANTALYSTFAVVGKNPLRFLNTLLYCDCLFYALTMAAADRQSRCSPTCC